MVKGLTLLLCKMKVILKNDETPSAELEFFMVSLED